MEDGGRQFGLADTSVFVGMLLVSLAIGIYYAFKDKRKQSIENYYFGERKMSPVPVGLSTGVSFISSITILAYPAHAYMYGTEIIWFGLCTTVQVVVSCLYYIPLLHRIHLTSVYEYLELRFNKGIRTAASLMTMTSMLFYSGTVVYLTALALNATTPLTMTTSILLTSGLCTIYTTVGGMKAVIWNDVFQSGIMISGIFALLVKTTVDVGGVKNVWEAVGRGKRNTFLDTIAGQHGVFSIHRFFMGYNAASTVTARLNITSILLILRDCVLRFRVDPTIQHTFWTIFVGNGVYWVSSMCTNQAITQRYQSCRNVKEAKIACIVSDIVMLVMLITAACAGCAIYAYYEGCDPYLTGEISKRDQIVPYLVMEIFETTPGMAGLFVSAAYSGMLSTVSTAINSMAVLILQDFILPFKKHFGEAAKLTLSKVLCLSLGILVTGMAFITEVTGSNVVTFATSVIGSFRGPMLGLFMIGMHFPWTNGIGAAVGLVCGGLLTNWINLGQMLYKAKEVEQPLFSTQLCTNWTAAENYNITSTLATLTGATFNSTNVELNTDLMQENRPYIADTLYSISYLYIGSIGMCTTVITGLLMSFLTGRNDPKEMNSTLFVPLIDSKFFPESVVNFFNFGVQKYREKRSPNSVTENLLSGRPSVHDKIELEGKI